MFRFPDLDLELRDGVLGRDGRSLQLPPLPARLLAYLVENRGRVVPKIELLDAVWRDAHPSDASLYQALHNLRRALGVEVVRNRRGQGYELVLRVEDVPEPVDPHRLPLLGRDATLDRVGETLAHVREGRGRLLLIAGPAGIGKTRLLDEILGVAQQRGFRTCRGGSPQDQFEQALWPWEQALGDLTHAQRGILDALSATQRESLQRTFPALASEPSAPEALPPAAARLRLFEAVTRLLAQAARRRPLLLAFDDLHRADAMSLRLLEWVAERVANLPIALVAAHRDAALRTDQARADAIARLLATPNAASEPLGPLSREDVAVAVRAAHGEAASDAMTEAAYERSGGNPLFLRALLLSGEPFEGQPGAEVGAALDVHLSVLSEPARGRLRQLSVLGLEFDPELARALCDVGEEDWSDTLDEAERHGLLRRSGRSRAFTHALVWESLHAELPAADRRRLHARAFDLLDRTDEHALEARADHAARAVPEVDAEVAARCCIEASEAATRRLALESAERLLSQGLGLSTDAPPERRLALQVALAEARARLGDADGVAELVRPAVELARSLGDDEAHARIVLALAPFRDDANDPDPELIAMLEDALDAHRATTPLRAQLLSRLAHVRWYLEPFEQARELAREALRTAEHGDDPTVRVDVLIRAHRVLQTGPGDEEIRRQLAAQLETGIDVVRDRLVIVEASMTLAWEALVGGDRAAYDRCSERIEREAHEAHSPHVRWWRLAARTSREHLRGRLDRAEALAQEGLELAQGTEQPLGLPGYVLQMLAIRRSQARTAELEPLLARVADATPARIQWQIAWRLAELSGGRLGPARELLRTLTDVGFSPLGRDPSYGPTLLMLTEMSLALDDQAAMAAIRDLMLELGDRHVVGVPGFCHWGSVAHWLGCLCERLGETDEAERWYEDGLARDRGLGALEFVARGQLALGRSWARRKSVALASRGASLAVEGAALAEDLQMEWLTRSP